MFFDIGNWFRFKRINISFCYWEAKLHYFILFLMSALFAIDINTNNITGFLFMECKYLLIGPMTANFVYKYWISLHKCMAFSHVSEGNEFISLCVSEEFEFMWICHNVRRDVRRHHRTASFPLSLSGDQKCWNQSFRLLARTFTSEPYHTPIHHI